MGKHLGDYLQVLNMLRRETLVRINLLKIQSNSTSRSSMAPSTASNILFPVWNVFMSQFFQRLRLFTLMNFDLIDPLLDLQTGLGMDIKDISDSTIEIFVALTSLSTLTTIPRL